jgi:hypothetical protein
VPVDDGDPEAGLFEQPIRPLAQRLVRDDPLIGNLDEISMRCHFSTLRGAVVPAGRYPALNQGWTPAAVRTMRHFASQPSAKPKADVLVSV